MEQSLLNIWDLVLTPFYLLILIFIAKRQQERRYPRGHTLRGYYLNGLYVKFIGAIIIGLLYAFYYKGGDTFNYFSHANIINSALNDSFDKWIKLILNFSPEDSPEIYPYVSQLFWYDSPSEYIVCVITALLGLLTFNSYMPTALLFAFISYSGIWAMYRTFLAIYPALHKVLAIAFLFIPSTFVWGSAIFKDTICMFGLGWMTYTTFRIFINKDFSAKNLFFLILSFYLIGLTKVYILLAFLPALGLWLLLMYSKKIKSVAVRWTVNILFVSVITTGFFFVSQRFAEQLDHYSLENLAETARRTQDWITYISSEEGGSAYDLGEFDPSVTGMLSKFPQAVTVTLYRPFPWEVRKPIMLLSAFESFVFVILTVLIFYHLGFFKTLKKIITDPTLIFFLTFTLIFAFAIGISTGNFGSLSRYKIPCMPFFGALLLVLYYQNKPTTDSPKKSGIAKKVSRQPA